MKKPAYHLSFNTAREAGNISEMIRHAWLEIDDPQRFCHTEFSFLTEMAVVNLDFDGLEELRSRAAQKILRYQRDDRFKYEFPRKVAKLDLHIENARRLREILDIVGETPGTTRAELYAKYSVYRTKADMVKGERSKPPECRVTEYVPTTHFEILLRSPLLRVEGEGLDARVYASGVQPLRIAMANLQRPTSRVDGSRRGERVLVPGRAGGGTGCLAILVLMCGVVFVILLLPK